MHHMRYLLVAGVLFGWHQSAHAGVPAWCKGQDLKKNSSWDFDKNYVQRQGDPSRVEEIIDWACSNNENVEKQRANIEKARAELSKRLYMTDADWSDAVAWHTEEGGRSSASDSDVAAKTFAALSPLDQYLVISKGLRQDYGGADALYLADALEPNLTEPGRFAFLESCLASEHQGSVFSERAGEPVYWSICLTDLAKFDPNKFAAELRGDTAHSVKERFSLRLRLGDVMDQLQVFTEAGKKMAKKDDAYQKLFDTAAKGRAEWEKTLGTQKELLALVQQLDSATYFHSKKLYAGCEEKTEKALADAVSKIPAKTFTGLHDNEDGIDGFAHDSAMKIVGFPEVNLAATAFVLCQPERAWSYPLRWALQAMPGWRGPRSGAFAAVFGPKFELDDTKEGEIKKPRVGPRPYGTSYGMLRSWGGVLSGTKPGKTDQGEGTTLSQPKSSMTTEDCVKWHSTNKLIGWDTAGNPTYESICDKTAMVKHDTTPRDVVVSASTAKVLKPGMRFSVVYPHDKGLPDVFAVWTSKTAKLPSIVLGGTVK